MTQEELRKLPPTQIKAMVYDEMVTIENAQANIRMLNDVLRNLAGEPTVSATVNKSKKVEKS